MPADAAPVLAYDRPLAPGGVRISRSSTTVSIKIAPDTAARTIFHLVIPVILFVLAAGLAVGNLGTVNGLFGLVLAAVLLVIAGALVYQTLRQSRDPIIFTADPKMLRIENPLDVPPDRTVGVFEIETLRLRRHPLTASAFELEILTRDFPDRPRSPSPYWSAPASRGSTRSAACSPRPWRWGFLKRPRRAGAPMETEGFPSRE